MTRQDPAEIIAALWASFGPTVAERLEAIGAVLPAIADGAIASDPRVTAARRAAHNLAGALGSYGRPEGSATARALMAALDAARPDADEVASLLATLREQCA